LPFANLIMFEHFIAGELIFLLLGKHLGFNITQTFLLFGSFCGWFPDLLSFFLSRHTHYNKWYHSHRDNFSHSIFLPLVIFAAAAFPFGWKIALIISLAALSHPLLDLYGLGWGVKLFLPISDDIYKIFFKKKLVYVYKDDKERNHDVERFQTDDWFRRIYFSFFTQKESILQRGKNIFGHKKLRNRILKSFDSAPKWWGFFEWISLMLTIFIPLLYYFKVG
jgi:hypothetical protein